MTDQPTGRFVWHELWARDSGAAVRYYTKALPWSAQVWDKNPQYTLFAHPSGMAAGAMALSAESLARGAKPTWASYIAVKDVDATLRHAEHLGARQLVAPEDVAHVGRFAVLADPFGALFGVLAQLTPRPIASGPPARGSAAWHELLTTDPQAALAFYQQLFGWDLMQRVDMGDAGSYLIFGANGQQMGGMFSPLKMPPSGPQWLTYIEVASADESIEHAVKAGGSLCFAPVTVPGGGRIANLIDPEGAMFAVHASPAATREASEAKPAGPRTSGKESAAAAGQESTGKSARKSTKGVRKR